MANKELLIRIAADSREAVQALQKIDKSAQQTQGAMGKLGNAAKGALAAFGTQQVLQFAGDTLRAASDLGESVNAVTVTFGDAADEVLAFGETAAESAGLAASEFNNLVVPIGAALQNFGLSAEEAGQKSIELAQRAADMASVFNVDVSEALGAIQAGLRGEADPLERFGVGLSAAAVQAYALENGLAATAGGITDNIKVQARLGLLMEQTNRVAGDFANTSEGLANQQRIAAAEAENLKAEIGQELQPAALALLKTFRELAPAIADGAGEVATLVSALGPLVSLIGNTVGKVFEWQESLDALSETSNGIVGDLGALADALGLTKGSLATAAEAVEKFEGKVKDGSDELKTAKNAIEDTGDSWSRMGRTISSEVTPAVSIVTQKTESYTRTIRDLITAQSEAASPALALINANLRLADAQNEASVAASEFGENSEEARDAQLALLSAVGDLDGALGVFKQEGGAQSIEALRALAERAGLSEDAIRRLIEQIGNLNDTPIKGVRSNGDGTYSIGTIKGPVGLYDTGGVVPGPRGKAQLAVVHGGETILPTHKGPVSVGSVGSAASGGGYTGPLQLVVNGRVFAEVVRDELVKLQGRSGPLGF